MPEFSDDETVMIENAFQEVLDVLTQMEPSPEVEALAQKVVEAQQIVTSKIEGSGSEKNMVAEASPGGPGV